MLITQSLSWVSWLRERNEGLRSRSPASSHMCHIGLFPAACGHSQGVALPHRLSHAASLYSTTRGLVTIRSCHPAGRDLEHHARQYTCGFLSLPLNLGQCARDWSSAHGSNASYIEAVHEPHQHLGSLARQMLCSQVRRVGLGGDLLHSELPAAHRLLKP